MTTPAPAEDSWYALAQDIVHRTLAALPPDLRTHAQAIPVLYEERPDADLLADGIDADTLGLFIGCPINQALDSPDVMPAQIILYIENLRELADGDTGFFTEEVETTYLHELGHYLGLDEDDLEERGLD